MGVVISRSSQADSGRRLSKQLAAVGCQLEATLQHSKVTEDYCRETRKEVRDTDNGLREQLVQDPLTSESY